MNTDLESVKLYRETFYHSDIIDDIRRVQDVDYTPPPGILPFFSLPLGFHLLLPGSREEKGQIEKNNSMVEFLVYVKKSSGGGKNFQGKVTLGK